MNSLNLDNPGLAVDLGFFELLTGSHLHYLGYPLVPAGRSPQDAARWLYEESPQCLLAHNRAADPHFIYANKAVQACFEYSWGEMISLPSRLSAEAPDRAERQRLLDKVSRDGFANDYRGVRIAKSGRRFWIENVAVWQLVDKDGVLHGQAAVFQGWRDL
ncbi:MAG TPA: MEKHLA domain-containing protein [Bryobacteraceae bacterium]|nr:MEKHLA domain-containing protein [Bryobacteraceae bacterium]